MQEWLQAQRAMAQGTTQGTATGNAPGDSNGPGSRGRRGSITPTGRGKAPPAAGSKSKSGSSSMHISGSGPGAAGTGVLSERPRGRGFHFSSRSQDKMLDRSTSPRPADGSNHSSHEEHTAPGQPQSLQPPPSSAGEARRGQGGNSPGDDASGQHQHQHQHQEHPVSMQQPPGAANMPPWMLGPYGMQGTAVPPPWSGPSPPPPGAGWGMPPYGGPIPPLAPWVGHPG